MAGRTRKSCKSGNTGPDDQQRFHQSRIDRSASRRTTRKSSTYKSLNEGLFAINADGSQSVLLTNDPITQLAVSPNGRMAAYLTHPDPGNSLYTHPFGYTLKLLHMDTGQLITIASLDLPGVSSTSSAEEFVFAIMTLEALKRDGLVWPPGSTYLAFTSGHESYSGDIYFYVTTNGEIRRNTHLDLPGGPAFAYQLNFSPTGRALFYTATYRLGFDGEHDWLAGAFI